MIRLPRPPRTTVARLMAIVAAVALVLGGGRWAVVMGHRMEERGREARRHEAAARFWPRLADLVRNRELFVRKPTDPERQLAGDVDHGPAGRWDDLQAVEWTSPDEVVLGRDEAEAICRARAAFHAAMAAKWRRAAHRPWAGVDPDPPRPPVSYIPGPAGGAY